MINFDVWRAEYDLMTYEDQLAFYDLVWAKHPVQKHYDPGAVAKFFSAHLAYTEPASVLEIGGWRGELAAEMLGLWPLNADIREWTNLEICRGAVENSIPLDVRYHPVVPGGFLWDYDQGMFAPYNVLVASHVIEHMRARELWSFLSRQKALWVYLASPLDEEDRDWTGYNGSHILEIGWRKITSMMGELGYRHRPHHDTREVRVFWRNI